MTRTLLLLLALSTPFLALAGAEPAVCAGDFTTGGECAVDAWESAGVGLFTCMDPEEGAYWVRVGDLVTTKCTVPALP